MMHIPRKFALLIIALLAGLVFAQGKDDASVKTVSAGKKPSLPVLIIARPVDLSVETAGKGGWLGPLNEAALYFRLGAVNGIVIVPRDTLLRRIDGFGKAGEGVPESAYLQFARKRGVTHILFQRYELIDKGLNVEYLAELFSVADSKPIASAERSFAVKEFPRELDAWIGTVIKTLGAGTSEAVGRFFRLPVMGDDDKDFMQLGTFVQSDWYAKDGSAAGVGGKYAGLASKNRSLALAAWLGAIAYRKAGKPAEAASLLDNLLLTIGPVYPSLYALACDGYRQAKRYDDALRMAMLAEKAGITGRDLLVRKGMVLEEKRDRAKAEETYGRVLELDPTEPHALLFFAQRSNEAKEWSRALEFADKALKADPTSGRALLERGRSLMATGRADDAVKSLTAAGRLLKGDPQPLALLGDLYAQRKDFLRAAENYQAAAPLMPDDLDIRLKAVAALKAIKKPKDALEILKKSEAAFSRRAALYREMGLLELALGDSTSALAHLVMHRKSGEKDGEVLVALGNLYIRSGKIDQAQSALSDALPLAADKNSCRVVLARIQLAKKQYREAATLLGEVTATQPAYPEVAGLLGDAYLGMGDKAKALSYYTSERSARGTTKALQTHIATLTLALGTSAAAAREYQSLVKLDPANAGAWFTLASVSLKLGRLPEAEGYLAKALTLGKPDPEILFAFAGAYLVLNSPVKAIDFYNRCLDAQPQHVGALQRLSELYVKRGTDSLAAETCLRLYQVDNEKYKAGLILAAECFERARLDARAKSAYAEFIDNKKFVDARVSLQWAQLEYRAKNCPKVLSLLAGVTGAPAAALDVLVMRAECSAAVGRDADGLSAADRIIIRDPQNARAFEIGALCADKLGDSQKATSLYEGFLTLNKTSPQRSEYAFRIGQVYEKTNFRTQAIARYTKNLIAYPKDVRNYERLALLYQADNRAGDALAVLRKALEVPGVATPALQKMAAQTLAKGPNIQEAIAIYQRYLKGVPDDSTALYELGMLLYSRKDYQQSAEKLSQASVFMPKNYTLYFALGNAWQQAGSPEKAVPAFDRARSLNEKDTLPLIALASCYRSLKRDNDLVGVLRKLAEFNPRDAEVSRELGILLVKTGNAPDALRWLEAASRARPNDVELHLSIATIYRQQNNDALRIIHLESALQIEPRRFSIHDELGQYYLDKKSYAKAIDYFRSAVALDSRNAATRYNYGSALQALNRKDEALDQFRAAVTVEGTNLTYLVKVIELSYRVGQKKAALAGVKLALDLDGASKNAALQYWAGVLLFESGSPDSARQFLEKAAAADKECAECFEYLGDIAVSEGRAGDAVKQYRKSLDVNGNNEVVLVKAGVALLKDKKTSEAETIFERATGQNPRNDEARYRLCSIYLESDRQDLAQQVYDRRPQSAQTGWALLLQGRISELKGSLREALVAFVSAARGLPDNVEAQGGCGRMYVANGDFENGLLYLGKAAAIDANNLRVIIDMGRAYEGLKNPSAAADLYQEVIRQDPSNEEAYYRLARVQSKGDHLKSIETINEGLKRNPKSARLTMALGHEYRLTKRNNDAIEAYKSAERMGGTDGREASRFLGDIYFLVLKDRVTAKVCYDKYAKAGGTDAATLKRLREL